MLNMLIGAAILCILEILVLCIFRFKDDIEIFFLGLIWNLDRLIKTGHWNCQCELCRKSKDETR
jgi:hypothetical protein